MTTRCLAMSAALVCAVAVVRAQGDDWRHWQFIAPIAVPADATGGYVSVVVTPDIAGRARPDWADLRIVDDGGHEVPFVLRAWHDARHLESRPGRLLDRGWVPGQYSQFVLDLGGGGVVHNRVDLHVSGAGDFASWLEVASSDDARTWTVVRDRAPIYSLHEAGFGDWLQATYPDSGARYIRGRILDGARRYDVDAASVVHEVLTTPEFTPAAVTFAAAPSAGDRSVYVSSPPVPGLAIGELRFDAADQLFDRAVLVEASDDGVTWARAMEGAISRSQAAGTTTSMLNVRVDTASGAYWRVTIANRNDRPLRDVAIAAFEMPRRIAFRREAGRTYRLLVGNSRAARPQYDLARVAAGTSLDAAVRATAGPLGARPDFADTRPWTEQHPSVLWGAVALAVAVLGGLAVKTIRSS